MQDPNSNLQTPILSPVINEKKQQSDSKFKIILKSTAVSDQPELKPYLSPPKPKVNFVFDDMELLVE